MPNIHPRYICELVDSYQFMTDDLGGHSCLGKSVADLASTVPAYMYKQYCKELQAEVGREEAVCAWRRFQEFDARFGTSITNLKENKAAVDGVKQQPLTRERTQRSFSWT